MKGTVKFYNKEKGYGFIVTPEEKDLFFHVSDVENQEELTEGDKVKYTQVKTNRGLNDRLVQ